MSGEILQDGQPYGINPNACLDLAHHIKRLHETGFEIGLVIGGGNIFRGINLASMNIPRSPADQIGMLATIMNGIALQETLLSIGCPAKVFTALECPRVAESYSWHAATQAISSNTVAIFTGGTGNPYFTTDTAAAMRASEIQADVLLKATKVDGIYSKDPIKYPDAKKFHTLTYSDMLAQNLEVMDATSVALCRNSRIPILVFNMKQLKTTIDADLASLLSSGTLVSGD